MHRRPGGKADGKDQQVLIDRDEKEVEQAPGEVAFEDGAGVNDGPAVVFFAFPEAEAVGAFACKVDCQADAPGGDYEGVDYQKACHAAFYGNYPGVGNWEDAPKLIHL